jgi:hypothetical protein
MSITKGPWSYESGRVDAGGLPIAYVALGMGFTTPVSTGKLGEFLARSEANGKAIAAVPDMIDALTAVIEMNASPPVSNGVRVAVIEGCRRALALAGITP